MRVANLSSRCLSLVDGGDSQYGMLWGYGYGELYKLLVPRASSVRREAIGFAHRPRFERALESRVSELRGAYDDEALRRNVETGGHVNHPTKLSFKRHFKTKVTLLLGWHAREMRGFVHHRDGVVVKEDVLREKRRELRTSLRDRKFWLVVLNLHGEGKGHIVKGLKTVDVHSAKIKTLIP